MPGRHCNLLGETAQVLHYHLWDGEPGIAAERIGNLRLFYKKTLLIGFEGKICEPGPLLYDYCPCKKAQKRKQRGDTINTEKAKR